MSPINIKPQIDPVATKKWIEGYKCVLKEPIIKPKERNWITIAIFIIIGTPILIWFIIDWILPLLKLII